MYYFVISISFLMLCLSSCGNGSGNLLKIVDERDSLRRLSETQATILENYMNTVEVLTATLDSISVQEQMIFLSDGEMPVTKDDVKHNLMRFESILKQQEEKISRLETALAASKDSTNKSLQLIAHLKEQIREKNAEIEELNEELEKKNVDISMLRKQVESQKVTIDSQNATINELNQRTKKQGEALALQDSILNNGYVLIGSKSDLKRKGITNKGKLVANTVLDRNKFFKVNIKKWREITFQAKRPRILTNMPSSTYELTTTGDKNFTLHIKNPADFWSISNYLVIQTD